MGRKRRLDPFTVQADVSKGRAHPYRSLAAGGAGADEIFNKAAVIDELLRTQPLDQLTDQGGIVTLIDQLAAQIRGRVVAARQGVEGSEAGRAMIERIYRHPIKTVCVPAPASTSMASPGGALGASCLFDVAAIHGRPFRNELRADRRLDVPHDRRVLL